MKGGSKGRVQTGFNGGVKGGLKGEIEGVGLNGNSNGVNGFEGEFKEGFNVGSTGVSTGLEKAGLKRFNIMEGLNGGPKTVRKEVETLPNAAGKAAMVEPSLK